MIIIKNIFIVIAALLVSGFIYQKIGRSRDARRNPPPGEMVDVGDHKLHLLSKGNAGGPTVIIEQGTSEHSANWWPMQERIAEFAHVYTYDRPGYAWSAPVSGSRTVEERAEELYTLLTNAKVPGPYILVAHSYGGFIIRQFTRTHPKDVAGLVFVDTPEDLFASRPEVLACYVQVGRISRFLTFLARFGVIRLASDIIRKEQFDLTLPADPAHYAAAVDDVASIRTFVETHKGAAAETFGNLPLSVIMHGKPFPPPFVPFEAGWEEGQRRLAALSTEGVLIVAKNSNHMIHLDEPDLVLGEIKRVYDVAKVRQPE